MSGRIRYTDEFKRATVVQVTEHGHSATSVAKRIGVSSKSPYDWMKQFGDASCHERKTHAAWQAEPGVTESVLQGLLGHARSSKITK